MLVLYLFVCVCALFLSVGVFKNTHKVYGMKQNIVTPLMSSSCSSGIIKKNQIFWTPFFRLQISLSEFFLFLWVSGFQKETPLIVRNTSCCCFWKGSSFWRFCLFPRTPCFVFHPNVLAWFYDYNSFWNDFLLMLFVLLAHFV